MEPRLGVAAGHLFNKLWAFCSKCVLCTAQPTWAVGKPMTQGRVHGVLLAVADRVAVSVPPLCAAADSRGSCQRCLCCESNIGH